MQRLNNPGNPENPVNPGYPGKRKDALGHLDFSLFWSLP